MKCDRCKKETNVWSMSWFNYDHICPDCKVEEQNHPDYERAKQVIYDAEKNGDMNYEGIGWNK